MTRVDGRVLSWVFFILLVLAVPGAWAQSGAIRGKVLGPDGQPMAGITVQLRNDITGFRAEATTSNDGTFQFFNVPYNPYELHVDAKGFRPEHRTVDVRSTVPTQVDVSLTVIAASETVTVTAEPTAAQLETDTSTSHIDIDKSYIARAPATIASRAMEELVTSTPGFAKDENGRFHFQGFHSQSEYVVDGQTISDQTGMTFSNSIDPGIAQSIEVIYGNVPAEYGEKPGSVIHLATKSGLSTPFRGELYGGGARFATYEGGLSLGGGSRNFGAYGSVNGAWSDRFLDPPNFANLHNHGDTQRAFLRLDYASSDLKDQVRFTALGGRTHRDVPNTFSQQDAGQDQTVKSRDANLNLGWTHILSPTATFEASGFARLSSFKLFPSPNDTPVTVISDRTLNNYGANAAVTVSSGHHDFKLGGTVKQFPIEETFTFGLTDPGLNDPGLDSFNPNLEPFDLTRGGRLFTFHGKRTGTYYAGYIQDNLHYGDFTANLGLRYDHNNLPTTEDQLQPRVGLVYYIQPTRTVLRGSYNRVFVTPEYENILFSSSAETASLVPPVVQDSRELGGGVLLPRSERQNAYTVGAQQAVGKKLRLDVDFWWRRATFNADQDQLENTGIVFPITFSSGRHNGWDVRLDLAETHGVRGFVSLGHVHAIYVPPPVGGLFLDASKVDLLTAGPFLIDHDQKLQAQAQLLWDVGTSGLWLGAGVRYDSGLVTGVSPTDLLSDPDNAFAAPYIVVHSGTDLDPNRIKERTIANFSLGLDLTRHHLPVVLQADLLNAFDTQGAYNILSVFGGTHVIPPRTLAVRARYRFGKS
jgi:carboxypeptidase family protein/TonB-dependent receptor-like protein